MTEEEKRNDFALEKKESEHIITDGNNYSDVDVNGTNYGDVDVKVSTGSSAVYIYIYIYIYYG